MSVRLTETSNLSVHPIQVTKKTIVGVDLDNLPVSSISNITNVFIKDTVVRTFSNERFYSRVTASLEGDKKVGFGFIIDGKTTSSNPEYLITGSASIYSNKPIVFDLYVSHGKNPFATVLDIFECFDHAVIPKLSESMALLLKTTDTPHTMVFVYSFSLNHIFIPLIAGLDPKIQQDFVFYLVVSNASSSACKVFNIDCHFQVSRLSEEIYVESHMGI